MASLWKAEGTYRDKARVVARLKRLAEKKGDRNAAIALLEEFVITGGELDRIPLPHFQRLAIRFVVRAVREMLEGKNPKAAFCVDAEGRPPVSAERDLIIALRVAHTYKKASSETKGRLDWAVNQVSRQMGPGNGPRAMVAAAVKRFGGVKDALKMVDELEYDPDVARAMRQPSARRRRVKESA